MGPSESFVRRNRSHNILEPQIEAAPTVHDVRNLAQSGLKGMEHSAIRPNDGISSVGSSDLQSRRGPTMEGFQLRPEKVKFKQV